MKPLTILLLTAFVAMPGFVVADTDQASGVIVSSDDVGPLPNPDGQTSTHELFTATDAHAAFTVDTCGGYADPTPTVWYAVWGNEDAPDWWLRMATQSSTEDLGSGGTVQGFVILDSLLVGDAFGYGMCCACQMGYKDYCIVYTKEGKACCCEAVMGDGFWDWDCVCNYGACKSNTA